MEPLEVSLSLCFLRSVSTRKCRGLLQRSGVTALELRKGKRRTTAGRRQKSYFLWAITKLGEPSFPRTKTKRNTAYCAVNRPFCLTKWITAYAPACSPHFNMKSSYSNICCCFWGPTCRTTALTSTDCVGSPSAEPADGHRHKAGQGDEAGQ